MKSDSFSHAVFSGQTGFLFSKTCNICLNEWGPREMSAVRLYIFNMLTHSRKWRAKVIVPFLCLNPAFEHSAGNHSDEYMAEIYLMAHSG